MATILLRSGESANTPYSQYIVDSAADLANCERVFGTMALVIDEQTFYVCNSDGNFVSMEDGSEV